MNAEYVLEKLPAPEGKQKLVERRQDTYDIIRQILKKHKQTAAHYDSISKDFWKGNAYDTAKGLFNFCKSNIGYVVEPTLRQTTKTPAAILVDKNGDCKHYASFIVGVVESLRRQGYPIRSFYRFASYDRKKRSPGHVFAVVQDGSNQYWVDPVLNAFDKRSPEYFYKVDKTPPMADKIGELYDISGIPNGEYVGRLRPHWLEERMIKEMQRRRHRFHPHHSPFGHHNWPHHQQGLSQFQDRWHNKPTMRVSGTHWLDELPLPSSMRGTIEVDEVGKLSLRHLHLGDKLKHIKIRPGRLFKKVLGAVPRNAFLGLVKKNVFHMAEKFHAARKAKSKHWQQIMSKWDKLGGNGNKLETAISQGIKNYNKHHSRKITGYDEVSGYDDGGGLGEVYQAQFEHIQPESVGIAVIDDVAGLLAAAAPILASFKGILKALGVNTKKVDDEVSAADEKLISDHNDGEQYADDDGVTSHKAGNKTSVSTANGKQVLNIHKTSADDDPDIAESDDDAVSRPAGKKKTTAVKASDDDGSADDGGESVSSKVSNVFHQIEEFAKEHWKGMLITATVAVVAIKFIGSRPAPKRRR